MSVWLAKIAAAWRAAREGLEDHMADRFLYFAYGSNMLTRRLHARTSSCRVYKTGYVAEHTLTFSKISDDGSGKCYMEPIGGGAQHVEGVLFWIERAQKSALDEAEGLNRGYAEASVDVVTNKATERAVAYIATDTDRARRPYHWYKALVIAGAVEHGLSQEYIDRLWAVESRPDPMPNRRTKREAEAALQGTGIVFE